MSKAKPIERQIKRTAKPKAETRSANERAFSKLPQPSFSFTKVKIAVATLTTMNVAIARQTVS